jgi:hypothetical protein
VESLGFEPQTSGDITRIFPFFARAESIVYLRKGFYETKIHAYTMSSTYIAPNCPCPEKECPRHGKCEECVKHHTEKGEDPYCAR